MPSQGCLLFVITLYALSGVRGQQQEQQQRCHVCVSVAASTLADEVQHLFSDSALVSCEISSQVKVCPLGYKGCLTLTNGKGEVTRTCAILAVEGCRTANGVEYCYCSSPECNKPSHDPGPWVDDEDLAPSWQYEGSGHQGAGTTPPTASSPSPSPSPSIAHHLRPSPRHTLLLVLVLVAVTR